MPGCEIHDDPLRPLCAECRGRVASQGDDLPISWLTRDARYVEKLATPDVTIADMIGDVDPIKAARSARELGDETTMHYGLVPRANRGIFAINELPDLASKVQVGLFNILQEGDVQIKGYPVRLRLDLLLTFSANPEDYTARGKIITPLKDRIGSEIRTHYPRSRHESMTITAQEAWIDRPEGTANASTVHVPAFVREVVDELAFQARADQKIDKRSGVSQRLPITTLENVVSNAERRALIHGETPVVPRVSDIYASLPSITGKLELEYEGELKGAEQVARDVIRQATAVVFDGYATDLDTRSVIDWFDGGGTLELIDTAPASDLIARTHGIDGLDAVGPGSWSLRPGARTDSCRRGRLRARRTLRPAQDQPLRCRPHLRIAGTRTTEARAAQPRSSDGRRAGAGWQGQEEVLQLTLTVWILTASRSGLGDMKYRYSRFVDDILDSDRSRSIDVAVVRPAAVERVQQPVGSAGRRRSDPAGACTTRSSMHC